MNTILLTKKKSIFLKIRDIFENHQSKKDIWNG